MANEVLSIILNVVAISSFVYLIFVCRKAHKVAIEAEQMLEEIRSEND